MGEQLLDLVLCEKYTPRMPEQEEKEKSKGRFHVNDTWRGKKCGDWALSNFPSLLGVIPATHSQESCVTEANNWKITASSPNDPQYTKVILLCLNTT